MTEITKTKIIMLRNQGVSFGNIAVKLDMPKETIKSFCKRHYKPVLLPEADANICVACGKHFEFGKRRTKYCSKECRQEWWNTHPEYVTKKAYYFQYCECCGKEFSSYGNSSRKYCSHECYIQDRFKGGKNGKADNKTAAECIADSC